MINKPTIPTNTNQLTNGSGYITDINLSIWNGAATSTGNKTIGNTANTNYVDIQENMRVKQNCTFSIRPTVNSAAVALSSDLHTHSNKAYLDIINQNLSTPSDVSFKSLKCTNDVIAYSTGISTEKLPIASKTALGTVKVGDGLNIDANGVISALPVTGSPGTVNVWGDIGGQLNNQKDLITALNGKSDTSHTHSNYSLTSHTHTNYSLTSHTHSYNALADKPTLFSGSYADLTNKPSLFSGNYNNLTNRPTIPTNTNQLTNGSGYITGINLSMWNGAATTVGTKTIGNSGNGNYVDIQENLRVKQNCTFSIRPTVNGSSVALSGELHNHSNLTYVNNINQSLATSATVQFSGVKSTGDVIAYSTGSGTQSPFKYWRPKVDSSGNLSWVNSTSETAISTVNIKGPAGSSWNGGTVTNTTLFNNTVTFQKVNTNTRIWGNAVDAWSDTTSGRPRLWLNYYKPSGWSYQSEVFIGDGAGNGTQVVTINADGNGKVLVKNGTGTLSDARLKHIFNKETNILDKIQNIYIYNYTRNDDEDKIMRTGVIAQEVAEVFPTLATKNFINEVTNEQYYTVDYATLGTVVAIGVAKELNEKINDLENKLNQILNNGDIT